MTKERELLTAIVDAHSALENAEYGSDRAVIKQDLEECIEAARSELAKPQAASDAAELDRLRAELAALKVDCPTGCGAPGEIGCCHAERCPDAPAVVQDLAAWLREHFPGETGDVATVVKRLLSQLKGEAERTVYVGKARPDEDANHAIDRCIMGACWHRLENADAGLGAYAVRLSARKVEP